MKLLSLISTEIDVNHQVRFFFHKKIQTWLFPWQKLVIRQKASFLPSFCTLQVDLQISCFLTLELPIFPSTNVKRWVSTVSAFKFSKIPTDFLQRHNFNSRKPAPYTIRFELFTVTRLYSEKCNVLRSRLEFETCHISKRSFIKVIAPHFQL